MNNVFVNQTLVVRKSVALPLTRLITSSVLASLANTLFKLAGFTSSAVLYFLLVDDPQVCRREFGCQDALVVFQVAFHIGSDTNTLQRDTSLVFVRRGGLGRVNSNNQTAADSQALERFKKDALLSDSNCPSYRDRTFEMHK